MTRRQEVQRDEAIKAACGLVLEGDRPLGSCFRIAERFALTCAHVPRHARHVDVRFGDDVVPAAIVSTDDGADAALLELATASRHYLRMFGPGQRSTWRTFGYPAIAKAADGSLVGHWFHGTITDTTGVDTARRPAMVLESPMIKDERVHGLSGSPVLVGGGAIGILKRILPRAPGEATAAFGFLYASSTVMVRSLLIQAGAGPPASTLGRTDATGPERPVRTVTLRQKTADLTCDSHRFELPAILVGRGRDNDFVVRHAKVSERHGMFSFRDDTLCYTDTSRGGSILISAAGPRLIGFEETVEVPLLGAIILGDSGVQIEVTSVGRAQRSDR